MSDWLDSWFDYYFIELGQTERFEITFRVICFGLILADILFCLFSWSIKARDVGFILSMALVFAFVKLCATVVDSILPDR